MIVQRRQGEQPGDFASSAVSAGADLCRVTIDAAGRRIDLTVPAWAPIVELTPSIAELFDAWPRDSAGTPPVWTLARPGAPALALSSSLADAGVMDGEVLYLVDVGAWQAPVSELDAEVRESIETGGRRWTRDATAGLIGGVAVLDLAAAIVLGARSGAVSGWAGAGPLLGAVGLLLGATTLPSRRGPSVALLVRLALAAGACVLGPYGAWVLAGAPVNAAGLAVAAGVLAATLLAAYPVVPALAPGATAATATLAGAAAAVAAGAHVDAVAAVMAAADVIVLRWLPRPLSALLAARAGRYRAGGAAGLVAAVRRGRELLVSITAGLAASMLMAIVAMLAVGGGFAAAVAVVATVSLLIRARSYRFVYEVLPVAVAGAASVVALEVAAAMRLGTGGLLTASGVVLAMVSVIWTALPAAPEAPEGAWLVVDLLLAPLTLGALGAFNAASALVERTLH